MTERTYHNRTSTFVPALRQRQPGTIDHVELAPVPAMQLLPPAQHTGHARQDDDAMTHAKATLLVSSGYIVAAALITTGLLLITWLFRGLGDAWATYAFTGLVAWGVAILAALWGNRRQSLWHSPTGIAHHEIDSRERVAMHAIDAHGKLLLRKWEIDNERD